MGSKVGLLQGSATLVTAATIVMVGTTTIWLIEEFHWNRIPLRPIDLFQTNLEIVFPRKERPVQTLHVVPLALLKRDLDVPIHRTTTVLRQNLLQMFFTAVTGYTRAPIIAVGREMVVEIRSTLAPYRMMNKIYFAMVLRVPFTLWIPIRLPTSTGSRLTPISLMLLMSLSP